MKAALKTAEGRFTIEEVEEPPLPAADWVKARVRMAGICGTDLRHWEKPDQHLRCCIMAMNSPARWSRLAPRSRVSAPVTAC